MYFFDTETVGFQGDTVLIQYWRPDMCSIILHEIFHETVDSTLELIHDMVEGVIGFNLSFDIFHITQTLNILSIYRQLHGGYAPPQLDKYYAIIDEYGDVSLPEQGKQSIYDLCFKPKHAFDLLLHGREGIFQAAMNQGPIYVRKFPKDRAQELINYLKQTVEIPDLYYGRKPEKKGQWQIKELHLGTGDEVTPQEYSQYEKDPEEYPLEIDPVWCNLKLSFYPSTSLKSLARFVLGYTDVLDFEDHESVGLEEFGYKPIGGNYREHISKHVIKWHSDQRERRYAEDDVIYTREIYGLFAWVQLMGNTIESYRELSADERLDIVKVTPLEELINVGTGTTNHSLAVEVGNTYWAGYSINRELVKNIYEEKKKLHDSNMKIVNFNSPRASVDYLSEAYTEEWHKACINNTRKATLEELIRDIKDAVEEMVTEDLAGKTDTSDEEKKRLTSEAWKYFEENQVEEELVLQFRAKFIYDARRNAKQVQLLEKLHKAGRLHVTFKVLGTKSNRMAGGSIGGSKGGSINPQGINAKGGLRECVTFTDYNQELVGGDFSGFEISIMEAVYSDPQLREELVSGRKFHAIWGSFLYGLSYDEMLLDENDVIYKKAKFSVFAEAYGADVPKLAEITGIKPEEVAKAKVEFQKKYPKIKESRDKLQRDFSAIVQNPQTGHIEWREPCEYIESILGFKRFFTIEQRIMKALFQLACDLPDEFKGGSDERYERNGKMQSRESGARSAIFGAAFSLQNQVLRAAGNHEIQSPGGEMTKRLQERFWNLQPTGIGKFIIKPFNVHDELCNPCKPELKNKILDIKNKFIEEYQSIIPTLAMDWKEGNNWQEIH